MMVSYHQVVGDEAVMGVHVEAGAAALLEAAVFDG